MRPLETAWARIAAAAAAERVTLERALVDPAQQRAWLAQILQTNAGSDFGREHGFAEMRSLDATGSSERMAGSKC